MSITTEQFTAATHAHLDKSASLSNIALAATERLLALNLNAARSILEVSVANAKTLVAAKDMQGLISDQASLIQPVLEKSVAYSRDLYELCAETNEKISGFVESHVAELNQNVESVLDKAIKNAPSGSDVTIAAVKNTITAATSAFDAMHKATKGIAQIAEANMAAATSATSKAVAATRTRKAA